MLKDTKTWDVRCPQTLADLFPNRTGYYFKIDRTQAQGVCSVLSVEYGIKCPNISDQPPHGGNNGECHYIGSGAKKQSVIYIHARGHIKTTIHEWYHHLDWMTNGKYNSSDRRGGSDSLAWQFADRLFEVFRKMKAQP
jgi:hypothetical protein